MYSLVDAPVLAYDLARHRNGPAVAALLGRAAQLGPPDLPVLAGEFTDDAERTAAWAEVGAVCGAAPKLAGSLVAVAEAAGGGRGADLVAAGELLAAAQTGDLADLLGAVRGELLDWTWQRVGELRLQTAAEAVAVVCDGLAAGYAGSALSPAARGRLATPWVAAVRRLPPAAEDLGPQTAALRVVLATLSAADADQIAGLDAAVSRERRGGGRYAPALHAAAWAAELTGRLRAAALAQLAGVRALPVAGHPGCPALAGAVTAVTAVLAAVVVADVLDETSTERLVAPWRAVFGAAALG